MKYRKHPQFSFYCEYKNIVGPENHKALPDLAFLYSSRGGGGGGVCVCVCVCVWGGGLPSPLWQAPSSVVCVLFTSSHFPGLHLPMKGRGNWWLCSGSLVTSCDMGL